MPAFLDQGLTDIRDAVAAVISHVGVAEDATAFNKTQTVLNPGGGTIFVASASKSNFDAATKDYSIQVTSADFGGKFINTIGVMKGSAAGDALSRAVRTFGIGVEPANDTFNLSVRLGHEDNTA